MAVRESSGNNPVQPFHSLEEAVGPMKANQPAAYYGETSHCSFRFTIRITQDETALPS